MDNTEKDGERGVWVRDEHMKLCGSPTVALFLAQLVYWSERDFVAARQGWFYKSRNEWQSETCLSRYHQEKARKALRGMGLLKERPQRLNSGIRLWFWLDQVRLNMMINGLAEQEENVLSEENTTVLYDSTLNEHKEQDIADSVVDIKNTDESRSIEDNKTIVPNSPLKGENSTIAQKNITIKENNNSHIDCIDDDKNLNTEAIPSVQPEPHCTDVQTYTGCHPFIYQFMKTRILSGHESCSHAKTLFVQHGFDDDQIMDALLCFIDRHGQQIINWYMGNTPVKIDTLNKDDIDLAKILSRRQLSVKNEAGFYP